MAKSLDETRLKAALRQLVDLERRADEGCRHARTIKSSKASFDGRTLLELSNRVTPELQKLGEWFADLEREARTLSRSVDSRPPKVVRPGQSGSSAGGLVVQLRPLVDRARKKLEELSKELQGLNRIAEEKVNEPGRWGSAAVSTPVTDLIELVGSLIELIVAVRKGG